MIAAQAQIASTGPKAHVAGCIFRSHLAYGLRVVNLVPADGGPMRGRTGVVIAVLTALIALAGLAAWLLLAPDAANTARRGSPLHALAASEFTGDTKEVESGDSGSGVANTSSNPRAESDDAARVQRGGGQGAQDATALAGEDGGAGINRNEVNSPVPGHLLIRVVDRAEDRPLPGASVHYPVRGSRMAAENGEAKAGAAAALSRRRANRYGACVWSAAELQLLRGFANKLNEIADPTWSVLVTHAGYADLFEPLAMPDLAKGAEFTLRMDSAVRATGRVREKKGGVVKYAGVDVLQTSRQGDATAPTNRFSVTADAMGEFTLKVADTYIYRFEVKTPGYAPYQSREFDFRRDERHVSILLSTAAGMGGLVTDTAGKPIEGARVEATGEGLVSFSDSDGRFALDMVRDKVWSNEFVLRATAEGFAPTTRRVLANDLEIKIEMQTEATLRVVCVDPEGALVAGAAVSCVFVEGRQRHELAGETTNADGVAVFGSLGNGQAQVSAKLEAMASPTVTVTVKAGANAEARLVMRPAATITGAVTSGGNPVAGATITLAGAPAGSSDESGTFNLTGVQAGEHTVGLVNQYPINEPRLRQLPVFTTDGKNYYYLPAARKIRAELGKTVTADFECAPFDAAVDRKITVKLRTQPQEPVIGVQVTITPVLSSPPSGLPQLQTMVLDMPEGRAEMPLSLLEGVNYEVALHHNQYFPAKLEAPALARVRDGGAIQVELERAFVIKGYVRDSEGNGIEGVGLSRDRNNPWAQSASTDIHGYFEFGQLREGDYLVTAFRHGYYQEKSEVKVQGRDPEALALTLVGANEIRIVVKSGASPRPGAQVDVFRNDAEGDNPDDYKRHFNIGTTDANGLKYVNFHWVRNYQIVVRHGALVGFANFNNLKDVPEREFIIQLERGFDLRGAVIDADTQAPLRNLTVRAHLAPAGIDGRDGNFFQVNTNGAGEFHFRVAAGEYWFYVPRTGSHQSHSTQGQTVGAGSSGHVLAVPLREDIAGNYAQMVEFSAPQQMVGGQQYSVSVTVKNAGGTTWTSAGNNPWRLGSQSPRDNKRWGMSRVSIPQGVLVAPKQAITFQFTVTAPAKAGNHAMQWQMVQEGREWFGQMTQKLIIAVSAPPGERAAPAVRIGEQ